ncbi:hypothetical protein ACIBF5_09790 [Micromonospora sp. NPDC050417]|uniref:hypothetical protein n=1 Tax=Micromonospora sp. NPDC050417 TaxID=3364280 RepID=UPI0037949F65
MAEQPTFRTWPDAGQPPRAPSGLFPSGPVPGPTRPTYREPHPIQAGALAAGAGLTTAWLLFFGLLGGDLRGYVWWTVLAGAVAWLAALLLVRFGDRGAAVGVAFVTAFGWAIAAAAVAVRWSTAGWPLW